MPPRSSLLLFLSPVSLSLSLKASLFLSLEFPSPPSSMAETSALCSSAFSPVAAAAAASGGYRSREFSLLRFSKLSYDRPRPPRFIRFRVKASEDYSGDHSFGSFPWDSSFSDGEAIHWVPQEKITLFTADGLIQLGGSMVPRRTSPSDKKQGKLKTSPRPQRFQESDYMDPKQGLCLGALFDIAATNGLDMGRRLCIFGFCRSIEMLSDVVEDTVLEHGGEVVAAEKAGDGGLHEKLTMTVAVPLLWGVPPASETLHLAVRSGGGIVDRVYRQWDFL